MKMDTSNLQTEDIIYYLGSEQQKCWSDCATCWGRAFLHTKQDCSRFSLVSAEKCYIAYLSLRGIDKNE